MFPHAQLHPMGGYTLMELCSVLAVLAVTLSIALPSFSSLREEQALRTSQHALINALATARTEAVHRGTYVTLRTRGEWHQGWQIFADPNRSTTLDADETLLIEQGALPRGITITGNTPVRQHVTYMSDGRTSLGNGGLQMGTLTLCSQTLKTGYRLLANAAGRVRAERLPECG